MKYIILFTLLFFPLLGFSQDNMDSINIEYKYVETNPNLLNLSATNLIDASKSYKNSDNFRVLGTLSMILGGLLYQNNQKWGRVFLMGGMFLNINSLVERYNGHRNVKLSGENLKNYIKSLR